MGLSTVGEGCKRQMEPLIQDIVNNILPFLQDEVGLRCFFKKKKHLVLTGMPRLHYSSRYGIVSAPTCSLCSLQCSWANV